MFSKLTFLSKALIVALVAAIIGFLVYKFAPGIKVTDAQVGEKINVDAKEINNTTQATEMALPSKELSNLVTGKPLIRLAGYAWNAQAGLIAANGGAHTSKGSIAEQNGLNLEIIRQDWLKELTNLQMKFINEFDKGEAFPKEGAAGIIIMGDGVPYYISSTQQSLNDKYGANKYQLEVVGAIGMSNGEDKLIGPPSWKTNPQNMKGSLISAVIGDGDWVTTVNYAFANNLKVNSDPTTYDAEAVNFLASANDDYIESAKELIKSQKEGWTVPLKEVKDGKLTGKIINKKVDGCATWTPGDKQVFDELTGFTDIISTKEFNNQMPCTIVMVKQWADKNKDIVSNILKSTYTASNQIKQYEKWKMSAAENVATTFNQEDAKYWYDMFKGQKAEKNGVPYNMGGSKVFNYADAKQYYGLTDNVNRYKAVYDQVSKYLEKLNPAGFNQNVKRIVPFSEAFNISYVKSIDNITEGKTDKADYSQSKTNQITKGDYQINFETSRASLRPEGKDVLDQVYNILIQAEGGRVNIIGHTDNVGNKDGNYSLSRARAEAVKSYLIQKGIPANRFQKIDGRGQDEPSEDNATDAGRAKNRRVAISILN